MPVAVDTSAVLALADRDDAAHVTVSALLDTIREPLVIPLTALPELDYLLSTRLGEAASYAVMHALVQGEIAIDHLIPADLERATELMRTYQDARLGFVDSTIIALAERLQATRLVTLDRRHFTMVRPRHCTHFELLP